MPQVQFVNQAEGIRITKGMRLPRRYQDTLAWFREARKVIPQIPDVGGTEWFIMSEGASEKYIDFVLCNGIGARANVVIDRQFNNVTNTRL